MIHVVPNADLVEHELTDECICGPDVQYKDDNGDSFETPLVIHWSLDGREREAEGGTNWGLKKV